MKKVLSFFSEAIKNCNVFTAPVNLRYQLDPDYNTVAGGAISIGLIILLASVFFNAWLQLLNKESISSTTAIVRQFDPQYMSVSTDDFMFAVGVNNINLSDTTQNKYFDFKITKLNIVNGTKQQSSVQLSQCTENHWEQLGDQFVDTFRRSQLSKFLCPPRNFSIELSGKYTSEVFIYYKLQMVKCTGSNCRTQAQIDSFILKNTAFYFNFYYANTLLNPDQKQPISQFFQDKDYIMFSSTMGTSANLYIGQYAMDTDQSIYPWVESNVQSGYIISRAEKQSWDYLITPTQSLSKLYLRKSNIKLEIQRTFRKIDDMLSYIGGLFGIFAVAFGFVMKYYGQCSFQLEMCQKIFDYQNKKSQNNNQDPQELTVNNQTLNKSGWEDSQQKNKAAQQIIQPQQFGFLDFFLHFIYLALKKICNCNWRRMQVYHQSLEQMRYKLDVGQLLEKLSFYDRSFNTLFDQDQLKLLYLQEKYNFDEIRQERNMLAMRKDIIANLFGLATQFLPKKAEEDHVIEIKKTLKQIAFEKSRKRLQTFMGKSIQVFDILRQTGMKPIENEDNLNIPEQIKKALKMLQLKIQEGDIVSVRIYNGLQYELLQAFEKSKLKKTKNYATGKKYQRKVKAGDKQEREDNRLIVKEGSPNSSTRSIQNFLC